ncbi:MAG: hypoxanthine phosphoribosyltransferase [Evtepia sp.]|uniref:hypoxanthine phosphoribosyltransferase n=1 Tax=Evtepia sp. TaxID=2773933 RepID=UPI002A75B8F0|nr:hypoxanthine phosphoribosyltransferase [Evtepia sp.]MDY3015271.1 hypoxanthine phosphoribosyltransferase [Evtepia sp.]
MMEQDMQQILFTQEEIAARTREMAAQITKDYEGKSPLVVGILRGSFIFMADLVRHIDLPLTLDFMSASSYGSGTTSSGLVNIRLDLSEDIAGRDVILVEDILDTGNTLSKLVAELKTRTPASLKLCVMLDKPDRRTRPIEADYVGFKIPDAFVVGCGLDYDQRYRQLPYIGILSPSVYE